MTNGLTASVSGAATLNQCSSADQDIDHNSDGLPRTSVRRSRPVSLAQSNTAVCWSEQLLRAPAIPAQNVPGGIYNSESNLVVPISGTQALLAWPTTAPA